MKLEGRLCYLVVAMVDTGYWLVLRIATKQAPARSRHEGQVTVKSSPVTAAAAAECWRRYQAHLASLAAPGAGGGGR